MSDSSTSAAGDQSLFSVGRNCCAIGRAQHVGLMVDGEEYFNSFALAAEQATRSLVILSWDFHSGTPLRFDNVRQPPPAQLGDFLNWLVRRRRGLHIYVLDWDYPLVYGTDREFRPLFGLGWRPHHRVRASALAQHNNIWHSIMIINVYIHVLMPSSCKLVRNRVYSRLLGERNVGDEWRMSAGVFEPNR